MVWALQVEGGGAAGAHLLCSGTYILGRKEADILTEDRSVSRKHASVAVGALSAEELAEPSRLPSLQITCLGQFGITRNGQSALPRNTAVAIADGDVIRCGQATVVRLEHVAIVLSVPPGLATPGLQSLARQAGAHLLEGWDERCTHVLIPAQLGGEARSPAAAAAAVCGRLAGRPVVSEEWLSALCARIHTTEPLPDTSKYSCGPSGLAEGCRADLLSAHAFQDADGLQVGSHLSFAIAAAGGALVGGQGGSPGRAEGRRLVLLCAEGQPPHDSGAAWTTPRRLIEALESGSTAGMLEPQQGGPMQCAGEPAAGSPAPASPGASDATECGAPEDLSPPPRAPLFQAAPHELPRSQSAAPATPAATPIHTPKQAEAAAATPPGSTAPQRRPELQDGEVTRESASGAVHFAVATRALAAKRYEPVARGVIQGESGLKVVPNFKRFKKARRSDAAGVTPRLSLKSWTDPVVTSMNTDFLAEEHARMASDEEAEELFHATLPAVRAKPMADPMEDDDDVVDEDHTGRAAARGSKSARPAPSKPAKPPANIAGVNFENMARRGTLKSLKVPELKAFLSSRNLPVGGKKDELIARVTDALL